MFLTEQEILDTPRALKKTVHYFDGQKKTIKAFFREHTQRRFVVLGCGSSHMLAKGVAVLFQSFSNTAACAIAAGDYLADPTFWRKTIEDSIVISLSRSGQTSEMVWALRHIKDAAGCPVISISAKKQSDITPISDLEMTLDWCYDQSVCQTRTVTNLYAASLLLASVYDNDPGLEAAVRAAAENSEAFQKANRSQMEELSAREWNNIVVLADGPLCGIAEEAALAFTEISMLTGRYFHLLDYRHGPIVISNDQTLTIMVLQPDGGTLQDDMVRDVMSKGGTVMTVSAQDGNPYGSAAHVQISDIDSFAVWGIPFIYLAQMLSLQKSIRLGGNPDAPTGLDAYIKLT